MKTHQFFSVLLFVTLAISVFGQENVIAPQRTAEQEAMKQTDKLQQELNMTPEQAKLIYDINLRYARERQVSNKRSEALERMKSKNADIQQVLSQEQNEKLQSKRFERTTSESSTVIQNRPVNPPSFHSSSDYRSTSTIHVPPNDAPVRSSIRSVTSVNPTNSERQTVKRVTPNESTTPKNPSAVRQTVGTSPIVTRRTEIPATPTRK